MKFNVVAAGVLGLVFGCANVSYAGHDIFPPERIHCKVSAAGKMVCEGFDHAYLTEDTHTVNLTTRDEVFNFKSGAAYFTADKKEASVFFSYNNSLSKTVKLKTTSTTIYPDLEHYGWKKVKDDLYVCNTGYMSCPLTNIPFKS